MNSLVLNPQYVLRNDKDRFLIMDRVIQYFERNEVSFLHPDHAKFLSFFDGKLSYSDTLKNISKEFDISIDDAQKLTSMFVNRTQQTVLKYKGEYFFLPGSILVENTNNIQRDDLQDLEYHCSAPYDFKRKRLSFPRYVLLISTMKCFTDCVYCYADKSYPYTPMDTGRIIQLIDECKAIGVCNFDVSGGEFFLHPDWKVILDHLLSLGYSPEISTKIPISEKTIDYLLSCKVEKIQFSLDTLNDAIASQTLGTSFGYIKHFVNSIRYADQAGLKLIIKPTLTKETCTLENIRELMDFCDSLSNIERFVICCASYSRFKHLPSFKALYPNSDAVKQCRDYISSRQVYSKYRIIQDVYIDSKEMFCNEYSFKVRGRCTGNVEGCSILPDGKVSLCEETYWNNHLLLGDILNQTLQEVWNSEQALKLWDVQAESFSDSSACSQCPTISQCRKGKGVCYKMVIEAYGESNYDFPDPRCPKAPKPYIDYV